MRAVVSAEDHRQRREDSGDECRANENPARLLSQLGKLGGNGERFFDTIQFALTQRCQTSSGFFASLKQAQHGGEAGREQEHVPKAADIVDFQSQKHKHGGDERQE